MSKRLPEFRVCRVCGTFFKPKAANHVTCADEACQRKVSNNNTLLKNRRAEAASRQEAARVDSAPFKPCTTCKHWKKEPPGVTSMGGQCVASLFRACKPWDDAVHHCRREE